MLLTACLIFTDKLAIKTAFIEHWLKILKDIEQFYDRPKYEAVIE